jgi:DNA replication initiation complex subunit (GINS family)
MATLGRLADGAGVRSALTPLVTEYRAWITAQGDTLKGLTAARREVAEHLLHMANVAATRIERGIEVLATDAAALDAFRVANRAVAAALTKRLADASSSPSCC